MVGQSAGTDNVDTWLERLCNPTGGPVGAEQKNYLCKGECRPMRHETFSETALIHGPVQGWTTSGGKPVAVSSQRSTYGHELDSGIGFLAWNTPSLTHDAASWMKGAGQIGAQPRWPRRDAAGPAERTPRRASVTGARGGHPR